jgi:4,5-dihydroxyphthalate decarboxylase
MNRLVSTHVELGLLGPAARQALAVDLYPYGVKSNRKVLETIAEYSHEQGLTPRVMPMEEIFAPSTLDL